MSKFEKTNKSILALDPGTNSLGGVGLTYELDANGKIDLNTVKPVHKHGRQAFTSLQFTDADPKKDRGVFRRNNRRNARRKNRMNFVNTMAYQNMTKAEFAIYNMKQNSNLTKADRNAKGVKYVDVFKYYGYKTIYHAMVDALNGIKMPRPVVYALINYLMKHRGNFLSDIDVKHYDVHDVDLKKAFNDINSAYKITYKTDLDVINPKNAGKIEKVILDQNQSTKDKRPTLKKLIGTTNTTFTTALINALLGNPFGADKLLFVKGPVNDKSLWKLNFSSASVNESVDALNPHLDVNQHLILDTVQRLYMSLSNELQIPKGMTYLSEAAVAKYEEHARQLAKFKEFTLAFPTITKTNKKGKTVHINVGHDLYNAYLHMARHVSKKEVKNYISHDDFEKLVNKLAFKVSGDAGKVIAEYPHYAELKQLNENHRLLLRQRGANNMLVPRQLKEQELLKLIETQGKFYPELMVRDKDNAGNYKLQTLFEFKVPYWNGSMVRPEDQAKSGNGGGNAWMVTKTDDKITAFNYYKTVDAAKTASNFMDNLIGTDNHYYGQKVLAAHTLKYETFKVLDELNHVYVNGKPITNQAKHTIYPLFKENLVVTKAQAEKVLQNKFGLTKSQSIITGLSSGKQFNNSLTSYHTLKYILGDKVDDHKYMHDLNQIVAIDTIYADSTMKADQLKDIEWLSSDELHRLSHLSFSGMGKLSNKLLDGIRDENDQTLLDAMWTSTIKHNSWLAKPYVKNQIEKHNRHILDQMDLPELLKYLLATADVQTQKAIHKYIKYVVNFIQKDNHGCAPAIVAVESPRISYNDHSVPASQVGKLESKYKKLSKKQKDEFSEAVIHLAERAKELKAKKGSKMPKKEYLYFLAGGKDLYTGKDIDYGRLNEYQIDHCIPQSVVDDDSLDNLVLTEAAINHQKGDHFGSYVAAKTQQGLWRNLNAGNLMTNKKLKNLNMPDGEIDKYSKQAFLNHQFVVTGQSVKLLCQILSMILPNTQIIMLNGKMTHEIRTEYNFIKNRSEPQHHAFDAFICATNAMYLLDRYPKLAPLYTYGKNLYVDNIKPMKRLNLIQGLDPNINSQNDIDVKYRTWYAGYGHQVYGYALVNTPSELTDRHGALHKAKFQPAANKTGFKSLMETKPGRDVKQYGGYTGKQTSYAYIVKVNTIDTDGNADHVYYVDGVTVADRNRVAKMAPTKRDAFLIEQFKQQHPKLSKNDMSITKSKVLFGQKVQTPDGQIVKIATTGYQHPGDIISLSARFNRDATPAEFKAYVKKHHKDEEWQADELNAAYPVISKAILAHMGNLPESNREKLRNGYVLFKDLPINDFHKKVTKKGKTKIVLTDGKLSTLAKMLMGANMDGKAYALPGIDINSRYGSLQLVPMILPRGTKLIHESITGLDYHYETLD